MSISESDCKGLELANLTIPGPYTVHQFTNWCFLVLYVYCILCEPLCQLKYNGNTTNFPSAFAEPESKCLCCFVLISTYLVELQYLKYIVMPKCRQRNTHLYLTCYCPELIRGQVELQHKYQCIPHNVPHSLVLYLQRLFQLHITALLLLVKWQLAYEEPLYKHGSHEVTQSVFEGGHPAVVICDSASLQVPQQWSSMRMLQLFLMVATRSTRYGWNFNWC